MLRPVPCCWYSKVACTHQNGVCRQHSLTTGTMKNHREGLTGLLTSSTACRNAELPVPLASSSCTAQALSISDTVRQDWAGGLTASTARRRSLNRSACLGCRTSASPREQAQARLVCLMQLSDSRELDRWQSLCSLVEFCSSAPAAAVCCPPGGAHHPHGPSRSPTSRSARAVTRLGMQKVNQPFRSLYRQTTADLHTPRTILRSADIRASLWRPCQQVVHITR